MTLEKSIVPGLWRENNKLCAEMKALQSIGSYSMRGQILLKVAVNGCDGQESQSAKDDHKLADRASVR